jgi:hypothetical protein
VTNFVESQWESDIERAAGKVAFEWEVLSAVAQRRQLSPEEGRRRLSCYTAYSVINNAISEASGVRESPDTSETREPMSLEELLRKHENERVHTRLFTLGAHAIAEYIGKPLTTENVVAFALTIGDR